MINLDQISQDIPIAIFAGNQDALADPTNVAWLIDKLGTKVNEFVQIDQFDHQSFSIGRDMGYTANVLNLIKKY